MKKKPLTVDQAKEAIAAAQKQPSLVIVLLDQRSQGFKVVSDLTMKLKDNNDGTISLGYWEMQIPQTNPPTIGAKPVQTFVPLISYPGKYVPVDKIEVASSVPDNLKKTSAIIQ